MIYLFIILQIIVIFQNIKIEQPMYQGHSQNNLLLHKEQYNFDQSFVMAPINLNPNKTKSNNFKNLQSNAQRKPTLGEYQQYRLSQYMNRGVNSEETEVSINYNGRSVENKVIDVVTIDPDSHVIEIGQEFIELMIKNSSNEVSFIAIGGQKQAGKSFFCDKILNLAEIKGNYFSQKHNPGLYTFSVPFLKDDQNIFFLQVSGCSIDSQLYKILNTIALILSSSYVYASENNVRAASNNWTKFHECLIKSIKLFQTGQLNQNHHKELFPHKIYFLSRSKQLSNVELKNNPFFKQVETLFLPDAMAPTYTGKKEDLVSFSFLAKDCINPEYIKNAYNIFMKLYSAVEQKKYNELVINGNIVNKVLLALVTNLNANKKLKINTIYESIVKELYISAYNYCVMGYHDELQKYFDDEQPKNSQQMYEVFEKASNNALQKFNEFNLNKDLHEEFEKKLLAHIDSKEELICSINKQKTQQLLQEQFNRHGNQDLKSMIGRLKSFRKDLDDGRAQAIEEEILELFNLAGSGSQRILLKQIDQLTNEEQRLSREHQVLQGKRRQQQNTNLAQKRKFTQLQQQQATLIKNMKDLQQERASLLRKKQNLQKGQIDPQVLNQSKKQLQKLKEKERYTLQLLNKFKSQNNEEIITQMRENYEQKINNMIQRQKEIQKQLNDLETKAQGKGGEGQVKSKLKESQLKQATKPKAKQPTNKKKQNKQSSNKKP